MLLISKRKLLLCLVMAVDSWVSRLSLPLDFEFILEIFLKSILFTSASSMLSHISKDETRDSPSFKKTLISPFNWNIIRIIYTGLVSVLCLYPNYNVLNLMIALIPLPVSFLASAFEDPRRSVKDFAETYAIAAFLHIFMRQRCSEDFPQSYAICCNILACFIFAWPLVNGSITIMGTTGRLALLFLYPFAYSDSETSEAYLNSSMKQSIDSWIVLLQAVLVFIAISGLKGQLLMNMKQSLLALNYWAVFGLILFPILATQDFPMTLNEVRKDWMKPSWIRLTQQPTRTPFLYSFLHKYKWTFTQ